MAFTEEELQDYKIILDDFLKQKRPPVEIRDQVDIAYRIDKQSVEIFEIRPVFMKPKKKTEIPVAKTTYERTSDSWKIYWQRSDLKWHTYEVVTVVKNLDKFIQIVIEDEMGCFWG